MCKLFVCCHLRSELVFSFSAKRKEEEKLVMWKDRFSIMKIFIHCAHKKHEEVYENALHNFMHELRYARFQDAWEDEGKTLWSVSRAFSQTTSLNFMLVLREVNINEKWYTKSVTLMSSSAVLEAFSTATCFTLLCYYEILSILRRLMKILTCFVVGIYEQWCTHLYVTLTLNSV